MLPKLQIKPPNKGLCFFQFASLLLSRQRFQNLGTWQGVIKGVLGGERAGHLPREWSLESWPVLALGFLLLCVVSAGSLGSLRPEKKVELVGKCGKMCSAPTQVVKVNTLHGGQCGPMFAGASFLSVLSL